LAGYSFGGIVVYEMAQQLRKQGETTGLLALVDPTTSRPKPASIPRRAQLSHLLESTTHEGEKRPLHFKILHISHAIFTKAVEAVHWRWNKLQTTSWNKLRKMFCHVYFRFGYPLPTYLRRFYRDIVVRKAASQYTPQNYSAQIVIFQTKNFVETYWSTLCSEVVQVYDLPCKHHDIYLDGPHAPSLLHQLLNHLEKAKKIQA
jgi:thioesterase domain-containing protein